MIPNHKARWGFLVMVALLLPALLFACGAKPVFGLQDGDHTEPGATKSVDPTKPEIRLAAPSYVSIGDPFLVRLTANHPIEDMSVHWLGKTMEPSISVWNKMHVCLAMLGTDVKYTKPRSLDLVVTARIGGKKYSYKRKIDVRAKKFPRQDLTLPKNMVSPNKKSLERIYRERKIISTAWTTLSPKRMWSLPMQRPVPGSISSQYGLQRFLNGKPRSPHRGIDFRGPKGTPVKAVSNGKVILIGDFFFSGKSVYVDHGNGVVSMYFHLSKQLVKTGQTVKKGQTVGLIGSTGRSTGPHLHFSLVVQGKSVNPMPLFKATASSMLDKK